MYYSPEEIALVMQMNGSSAEDLLVQEYLAEARTTTSFLEQVSSCRDVLNILDLKFPSYFKKFLGFIQAFVFHPAQSN
jgi:hypothetical protein